MKHLLLILPLLLGSMSFANPTPESLLSNKAPRLYMKGTATQADYVEITYEVTFEGFVELHLFNREGKKIWIHGKVTDRAGVDRIRVPRKPLEPGQSYTFTLKYKGKDYNGRFTG